MNTNKKIILISTALLLIALFSWFFFSKKEIPKPKSTCLHGQTEIYEKYKNAVVLIKHRYKLQFIIKGSQPFTIDVASYGLEEQTVFGTGFFISKEGKIATNHHVAEPWKYDKNSPIDYLKEHIAAILPDSIPSENIKNYLEDNWESYAEDGEDLENQTLEDSIAQTNVSETTEFEKISINAIDIIPQTEEISIALHGSNNDWIDCKVINVSDEEEVDVAMIQTVNELLPTSVKNIVDIHSAIADDTSLKPGNKAILIGYPMGMILANTRKGIMVQSYEGQINKESDGTSIQYNITSTHGASGSPVFNDCGQLIAINYAGYDQAQGYNFGIVAKYVQQLAE